MTEAGSWKFKILFICIPASVLSRSLWGSTPTTAILERGNWKVRLLTRLQMVLAMVETCLWLVAFRRLLVPVHRMMSPGTSGYAPCCTRHATCSARSPPIPLFVHPGRYSWRREERAGRDNRSKWESPRRKFELGGRLRPARHCLSNLPPQVMVGFDLLQKVKGRAQGEIEGLYTRIIPSAPLP